MATHEDEDILAIRKAGEVICMDCCFSLFNQDMEKLKGIRLTGEILTRDEIEGDGKVWRCDKCGKTLLSQRKMAYKFLRC